MRPTDLRPILDHGVAGVLAAIFITAGGLKLIAPQDFSWAVHQYQLIPTAWENGVAICMPWWEIAAGVCLVLPAWRRIGSILAMSFALLFMGVVLSAFVRGLGIDCGCFGAWSLRSNLLTFLLDLLIFSAAFYLLEKA